MNRKSLLDDKRIFWGIIAVILLVGILVRAYKFGILMDAVQSDEMGTGYDAWCLLNYGTDRYGYSWPLYFNNYGRGQSAMLIYLCILSIKVFGFGRFAFRFPALVNSVVIAVFGMLTIDRCGKKDDRTRKLLLALAFLWVVAPYTFMVSKVALDCNLMSGFTAIFLYFLVRAYQSGKNSSYLVAGGMAGLLLYTYAVSYIVMPLMLLMAIVYMIYKKKVKLSNVISFVIPLGILAFPLLLVQYVNIFDKEPIRLGIFTVYKINGYSGDEVGFEGFFKWIYSGMKAVLIADDIEWNSDPRFFNFYPMSIPFFIYGLFLIMRNFVRNCKKGKTYVTGEAKEQLETGETGEAFVLMWFIAEVIAAGLMTDPNVNRLNGIMFPIMYFISLGFVTFIGLIKEKIKKPVTVVIAAAYLIYFGAFVYTYYTEIAFYDCTTSSMCPEALEFVNSRDDLRDKVVATNIPPVLYMCTAVSTPDKIDNEGNYKDDKYYCYSDSDYDSLTDYVYNEGGTDKIYLIYRPKDEDRETLNGLAATERKFGYSFYLYYWE